MRYLLTILLAATTLGLAGGCSTPRPDDFPIIEAHHPDGTGGRVSSEVPEGAPAGYVLEYAAGDEVVFSLELESDVLEVDGPVTARVVLIEPIRVAVQSGRMLVSIDGGPWEAPLQAFQGSISSGLSITTDDPVNRGTVELTANRR